ncbi:MAG: hypothetical protein ABS91_00655 [Thiobacillus sp. SCN 64-35]|nr:MAG: hypothetical protein ABS91_00655 [Thiobacillus sp. SCN 64-35]
MSGIDRFAAPLSCISLRRQRGLSLVELMIAMTLGLIILFAVAAVYTGSRQSFRMQEENARLQETGRFALEMIGRSVRQAGFWNMPINPVATATGFGGVPVNGTNGVTDTITVQYDGLTGDRDCEGTLLAANGVVTEVYSISANNELVCEGIDANNAASPLVGNIEDLQILYGSDTTADQSADRYQAVPANWGQVVTARVCIQVRSDNNVSNVSQRFLNCGGVLGTAVGAAAFTNSAAGDNTLRRTFVATFNLRNRVTNVP